MDRREVGRRTWTGFIWLGIRWSGGLAWMQWWNLWVASNAGDLLTAWQLTGIWRTHCSMDLAS